jgi:hypothetical protein
VTGKVVTPGAARGPATWGRGETAAWRALTGTRRRESYTQNPQNPQNPGRPGSRIGGRVRGAQFRGGSASRKTHANPAGTIESAFGGTSVSPSSAGIEAFFPAVAHGVLRVLRGGRRAHHGAHARPGEVLRGFCGAGLWAIWAFPGRLPQFGRGPRRGFAGSAGFAFRPTAEPHQALRRRAGGGSLPPDPGAPLGRRRPRPADVGVGARTRAS